MEVLLRFCRRNPECPDHGKRVAGSFAVLCGLLLAAAATGCKPKSRAETPEVPVVPVSHPVQRVVTDYVDFTGRTNAVQQVDIIARVTGYLVPVPKPAKEGPEVTKGQGGPRPAEDQDLMPFKEGSEVKKGDLLFEIDPRPYQAQFDQAQSQVVLDEAQLDLAKKTFERYQALAKTTPGAVSEQALDQYQAAVAEAKARLDSQNKSLEVYKLNKEFTRVVSPINGQVSRYYLTLGNLVNQDQTLLTTVVSLDPMYVYFDVDESTWLRILDLIKHKKIRAPAEGDLPILLGLQNEEGFPHKATINFVNNQVNSTTGSITMRGVFPNPPLIDEAEDPGAEEAGPASGMRRAPGARDPRAARAKASSAERASAPGVAGTEKNAPRQFSPGMFVRVRLPIGQPHEALLVIDRAIQSDQGLKFVYVLDAQNKAQTRSIKTGSLQQDGLRVVEGEIKADDWVVVGAIQQVRAQMEVKPDPRPMPSLAGQAEAAPPAAAGAKGTTSGQNVK
jgi:multidrug efflux system membrane fusion protein